MRGSGLRTVKGTLSPGSPSTRIISSTVCRCEIRCGGRPVRQRCAGCAGCRRSCHRITTREFNQHASPFPHRRLNLGTSTRKQQRDAATRGEEATPVQLIGDDISVLTDMVLAVRRFLDAIRWNVEVVRQIRVATVEPGLHRGSRHGAAIKTAAAFVFHLWVDLVLVPIMSIRGCCRGDKHQREDEPSHGMPQVPGAHTLGGAEWPA